MDSESPDKLTLLEDSAVEAVEPVAVASYAELDQPGKEDLPIDYMAAAAVSDRQLQIRFRNRGAAIAAIVLGCLAVFGAFLTLWSLCNAVCGLILGLQGLNSNLFRTSLIGICLSLIGMGLCFALYLKWWLYVI